MLNNQFLTGGMNESHQKEIEIADMKKKVFEGIE